MKGQDSNCSGRRNPVHAKYVLQCYQIDPKNLDPTPEAQQVVIATLNALTPWPYG